MQLNTVHRHYTYVHCIRYTLCQHTTLDCSSSSKPRIICVFNNLYNMIQLLYLINSNFYQIQFSDNVLALMNPIGNDLHWLIFRWWWFHHCYWTMLLFFLNDSMQIILSHHCQLLDNSASYIQWIKCEM